MHSFGRFIRQHPHLLSFGFLLAFFSSFGQTFLISLYVPEIGEVFQLSNTQLSSLYAAGTLGSAFCLPWVGRIIDTAALQRFTIAVLLGLMLSLLLLSLAPHPAVVLLGFFGLRLSGQGLMSHTSISTMARSFDGGRGKAISLASLGHPAGEAVLPVIIALAITALGWRSALQLSAAFLLVVVVPLVLWLIRRSPRRATHPVPESGQTEAEVKQKRREGHPLRIVKTAAFWVIIPAVFLLGFINTALFFFQVQLGESRSWTAAWVAGSLAAFAGASALSMLFAGPLVDRLSARRAFPFFLLPYLAGLILLSLFRFPLIYPISLFLMGLGHGAGSTIKNALLAEVYGTDIIGSVRSLFTTVMVFSTALGPITFGLLLDNGLSYSQVLMFSAGAVLLSMLWSFQILSPFTLARWKLRLKYMRPFG